MKKILKKIIKWLDWVRWPGTKMHVLLVIDGQIGKACLVSFFEHLKKDGNFSVRVLYCNLKDLELSDNIHQRFESFYRISVFWAFWKKWDFLIFTDSTPVRFARPAIKIMTKHGAGFGNLEYKPDREDYFIETMSASGVNIAAHNSIVSIRKYAEARPDAMNNPEYIATVTGFMKTQELRASVQNNANFRRSVSGLDPAKKTIFIASHYNSKSLFCTCGLEFIQALVDSEKYNLIIGGHERLWVGKDGVLSEGSASAELQEYLKSTSKKSKNVIFVRHPDDIYSMLLNADLFIADNSSIVIEFAICDRPILLFEHSDFRFLDDRVRVLYKNASFQFSSAIGIVEIIENALKNPLLHKAKRKELMDFFLEHPDTAINNLVEILKFLGRGARVGGDRWNSLRERSKHNLLG